MKKICTNAHSEYTLIFFGNLAKVKKEKKFKYFGYLNITIR